MGFYLAKDDCKKMGSFTYVSVYGGLCLTRYIKNIRSSWTVLRREKSIGLSGRTSSRLQVKSTGEVISRVSSAFLGTPYQADALIGGSDTTEALVADFDCVNCVTLVDHVEVLTRSHDEKTFLHNLEEILYIGGASTT